jgi:hypothetical protein
VAEVAALVTVTLVIRAPSSDPAVAVVVEAEVTTAAAAAAVAKAPGITTTASPEVPAASLALVEAATAVGRVDRPVSTPAQVTVAPEAVLVLVALLARVAARVRGPRPTVANQPAAQEVMPRLRVPTQI